MNVYVCYIYVFNLKNVYADLSSLHPAQYSISLHESHYNGLSSTFMSRDNVLHL